MNFAHMFMSWKTSLAGIAAIVTAFGDMLTQIANSNVGAGNIEKDFLAIVVGIGFLAAKDSNVTGGTKPQCRRTKMAVNLSGVFGDISNLAGSVSLQDIIQQAAIGGAVTVGLAGLKSQDGQNALDPMHWFHHPASNTTGLVTGNVIAMSKFMALTPDQQKMFQALNYTIIPG